MYLNISFMNIHSIFIYRINYWNLDSVCCRWLLQFFCHVRSKELQKLLCWHYYGLSDCKVDKKHQTNWYNIYWLWLLSNSRLLSGQISSTDDDILYLHSFFCGCLRLGWNLCLFCQCNFSYISSVYLLFIHDSIIGLAQKFPLIIKLKTNMHYI